MPLKMHIKDIFGNDIKWYQHVYTPTPYTTYNDRYLSNFIRENMFVSQNETYI